MAVEGQATHRRSAERRLNCQLLRAALSDGHLSSSTNDGNGRQYCSHTGNNLPLLEVSPTKIL